MYIITQNNIHHQLENEDRAWLDACGFDRLFDPDACFDPFDPEAANKKPGPNAYPSYQPNRDMRVTWGEWGAEHITVPGNACGLDIDRRPFGTFLGEGCAALYPHNVDSWSQKQLLLIVFCSIAESIVLFAGNHERKAVST